MIFGSQIGGWSCSVRWRKTQMGRQEDRRKRTEEQEQKNRSGTAKNGRTRTEHKKQRPRTEEQEQRQRPEEQEQKDPNRKTRPAPRNRKTGTQNRTKEQKGRPQGKRQANTTSTPHQHQAHYPTKSTHPGAWQWTKQQTPPYKQQTLLLPPQLHSALRASLRCDVNYPRP